MKTPSFVRSYLGTALVLLLLTTPLQAEEQQAPAKVRKMPVSAITLKKQTIQLTQDVPGRASAYRVAEIRPQVTGIITNRLFEEGGMVKKGQQLYQIDPAPYRAVYNSTRADLLRAQANYKATAAKERRYAILVKDNAISKQEYDDVVAALYDAKASIAVAQASIDSAKINLNYTKVYSPITGQIGKSTITEGALVTANQTDYLAQVTQLDPIYVDMQEAQKNVLKLRVQASNTPEIKVKLDLNGKQENNLYREIGTLQFSEVTVDPTTSSVSLRAIFPNPDRILFPGLFVRAQLLLDKIEVIMIPQKAGIRGDGGLLSAWVIDSNNKAQSRKIVANNSYQNNWIVTEGLQEGDRVITSGFQRLRPGSPVQIDKTK